MVRSEAVQRMALAARVKALFPSLPVAPAFSLRQSSLNMSDFFCPDELTHSLRAWILVFLSGVDFCGGEFTRCIFLNEPLLIVAISPVRSAACTSTSLRVLAAVDPSTELKCCGPFVPRCK